MIRNEKEYQYTLERIADFESQVNSGRASLPAEGLNADAVELALEGILAILDEVRFERSFYERLKREGISAVPDYPSKERGKALVALRIATGRTQRELADALSVSEAQVSRDEKNEYNGVSQTRYARVLQALGVEEHVAGYVSPRVLTLSAPVFHQEAAAFPLSLPEDLVLRIEEA